MQVGTEVFLLRYNNVPTIEWPPVLTCSSSAPRPFRQRPPSHRQGLLDLIACTILVSDLENLSAAVSRLRTLCRNTRPSSRRTSWWWWRTSWYPRTTMPRGPDISPPAWPLAPYRYRPTQWWLTSRVGLSFWRQIPFSRETIFSIAWL